MGYVNLLIQHLGTQSETNEGGFGVLGGGGWSFEFGGSRLLLNVNYSYRGIQGEAYNTLGLSIGGLF